MSLDRAALIGSAPVVLVVAPAGYGKSVLAAQWATRENARIIELGWRHGKVHRLLDAIAPLGMRGMSQSDHLAYAIDSLAGRALVMDDLHSILGEPGISDVIERLVEAAGPYRLLLASRRDPMLTEVARARARQCLQELGPAELALSADQVGLLFERVSGRKQADEEVTAIWQQTGGWAALVVLLAGYTGGPISQTGHPKAILDYLLGVALADLTSEARRLLEIVGSVPEIRTSSACALAACPPEVASDLRRSGLIEEDQDKNVRMHALVRSAVRSQPIAIPPPAELSAMLFDLGEDEAALQLLIEAHLPDLVIREFAKWRLDDPERLKRNREWLGCVPFASFHGHPELARRAVLDRFWRSDTEGAEPVLKQAEAEARAKGDSEFADQLALDRTLVPRLQGNWAETQSRLAKLEPRLMRTQPAIRLRYLNFLAVALLHGPDSLRRAGPVFETILRESTATSMDAARHSALINRAASILRFCGTRSEIETALDEIRSESASDQENLGWELLIRAGVAVDEGDPNSEAVVEELAAWWAGSGRREIELEVAGLKAELLLRKGQTEAALKSARAVALSPLAHATTRIRAWVTAARGYASLGQADDIAACQDRVERLGAETFWHVWARVSMAGAWIAAGDPANAQQALDRAMPDIEAEGMKLLELRAMLFQQALRFDSGSFHALLARASSQGRESFLLSSEPALVRPLLRRALQHGATDDLTLRLCHQAGFVTVSFSFLGAFRCWVSGREVPDDAWVRPKAKALLAYLALRPQSQHVEQIMDALWPNRPVESSRVALHTTLSYLRKALGFDPFEVSESVLRRKEEVWFQIRDRRLSADTLLAHDGTESDWFQPFLPEHRYEEWARQGAEEWIQWRRQRVMEAMRRAMAMKRPRQALSLGSMELESSNELLDPDDELEGLLDRATQQLSKASL